MNQQVELNLKELPKEFCVLLEFLKRENESAITQINKEMLADLDWQEFYNLAIHHRVFPLLVSKLKKVDGIPNEVTHLLYQQYRRNTFRMLQLSAEMEQLSHIFSENDIRLLHLKGPVLASDLYGELSLRTCGDLDMLVSIDDVNQVDHLLSSLGYEKDDYIETVLGDWRWRHHHVTYFHSEKPIKVEIHWRLNPGPGFEPSFNELWQRKRVSSNSTSCPVYYLEREDLFFFLVTHGARHGWSRLRWLMDIDQMLRQDLQWGKLERRFKQYNALHVGGQALILTSQLLNVPIPEKAQNFIRGNHSKFLAQEAIFYLERMVSLHSLPVPENVAFYHKKHLFHLMSVQQRLLFILSFLYPYPEDADTLPLPKKLHFLYFPLRPFLWAWRKSTKQGLGRRRVS